MSEGDEIKISSSKAQSQKAYSYKVYQYSNCSTCKKALKFLDSNGVSYQSIPIIESPPSVEELKRVLRSIQARGGSIKALFNTSGELYKSLKVADQLKAGLSEAQALELLSENGKLVKRPLVIGEKEGWAGFNEELWKAEVFV